MKKGTVIGREMCPTCQDTGKDNVAVYDDGSKFCFGCNSPMGKSKFIDGKIVEISSRGLTSESCKFFDYQVAKLNNEWVHVANYKTTEGKTIAQKIRHKDKKMFITGDGKAMPLYGQWLWSPNEKLFITVVEGEIDALTVAQVQGYQYPVVSVPKGAAGARKALEENLRYLLGFRYVVLGFDNDEAGAEASKACLDLFEPGQVRVCKWTEKDPNEMLLNGKEKEIAQCIFQARSYQPENVVTPSDVLDRVLVQPKVGMPYPWKSMTEITYGFQLGEIHIVVASTGIGKTEFVKDIMFHFLEKDIKIGLFSFEQNPDNTLRRIVGAKLGLKLHLPGSEWPVEKIREETLKLQGHIYLYDKAGKASLVDLFTTIKYLAKAKDVKLFIIDNLKALGVSNDKEKAELLMNGVKTLCKELDITIMLLSHVAKDKYGMQTYVTTSPKNADTYNSQTAEEVDGMLKKPGLDWESGRTPTLANVEGPGIITHLADYVFALARNTTSEDSHESKTMRVKALKARLDSSFCGRMFKLVYSDEGKLEESGTNHLGRNHNGF